jgi:gliding motility-associated-like protein
MKKLISILLFFHFNYSDVSANHLIGGELSYRKLGGTNYEITLKVFRDCNAQNAANFDNPANIAIYENGVLINNIQIDLNNPTSVDPPQLASCIVVPSTVCVQKAIYITTVNLSASSYGYDLVYTRCCRNTSIQNLLDPGATGSTYYAYIPKTQTVATNSNPVFNSLPPIFLCINTPFVYDHSATDYDGDSISYYFCRPYAGATETDPLPIPADPPPFPLVNYSNPFNVGNQLSSNPAMTINASTGQLTVNPNALGQYVVGVCASEYRNGIFLSESKRDFQFNVIQCFNSIASIPDQTVFCNGLTVDFLNTSANSTNYLWDFGVTNSTTDVSSAQTPTFTYPAPGVYTVTLIATNVFNNTVACADTATTTLEVFPVLDPDFIVPLPQCLQGNSFNFSAGGAFDNSATFLWNFGSNANVSTLASQNANNIVFNTDSLIEVSLIVEQFGCSDTVRKNIEIFPQPIAEIGDVNKYCVGLQIDFENLTPNSPGTKFHWDFGIANTLSDTSNLYNPSYTFPDTANYTIELTVTSPNGCIDSDSEVFLVYPLLLPGVYPFNDSSYVNQCIDVNYFNFFASGAYSDSTDFIWQFGPNANPTSSNEKNPQGVTFNVAGTIPITITVQENGCSKSLSDTVRIYNRPTINYSLNTNKCYPFTVQFNNNCFAETPINYYWNFGDNTYSEMPNPLHVFENAGVYSTSLKIITKTGCKDTLDVSLDSIRFLPPPVAGLEIVPTKVSIFDPKVSFKDISTNKVSSSTVLGDGRTKFDSEFVYQYSDTGTYKVMNIAINEDGCRDTAFYDVIVFPEFRFWVPNSFTPNGDNLNDVFKPIIIGAKEYSFRIFDRWGNLIFDSTNDKEGWNGKINNSESDAPTGVYSYTIDILNVLKNFESKSGMIILNR